MAPNFDLELYIFFYEFATKLRNSIDKRITLRVEHIDERLTKLIILVCLYMFDFQTS